MDSRYFKLLYSVFRHNFSGAFKILEDFAQCSLGFMEESCRGKNHMNKKLHKNPRFVEIKNVHVYHIIFYAHSGLF